MTNKLKLIACTAVAGLALHATSALASADTMNRATTDTNVTRGAADTTANTSTSNVGTTAPLNQFEEGTRITLSGTISRIEERDEVFINTRYGEVKVDTNDDIQNWFTRDAKDLFNVGQRITVTGEVDDDFLGGREINAEYVSLMGDTYSMNYMPRTTATSATGTTGQNVGTTAGTRTQGRTGDVSGYYVYFFPYDEQNLRLSGVVEEVDNVNNTVTMNYNGGQLEVDISDIRDQSQGYRIERGDYITVYGDLVNPADPANREFEATRIIRTDYAPRG